MFSTFALSPALKVPASLYPSEPLWNHPPAITFKLNATLKVLSFVQSGEPGRTRTPVLLVIAKWTSKLPLREQPVQSRKFV
jgi:hypothetical protein